MIRIGSFDIGIKSFAECIMDIDPGYLSCLSDLHSIYKSMKRVHVAVIDLRSEADDESKYTSQTRKTLLDHLEQTCRLWDSCDIILIEQQMSAVSKFKSHINFHAIRASETLHTWFEYRNKYLLRPVRVIDVPSLWKTKYQSAPARMTYSQRKAWSVANLKVIAEAQRDHAVLALFELQEKVHKKRKIHPEEILAPYGWEETDKDVYRLAYRVVREKQKLDDVADTYNQIVGYLVHG